MLIEKVRIRALIPHAGSMCLVDRVADWNKEEILCVATSHRDPDNPLRRNGRISAICGVEYAAQAMALHGALTASSAQRQRPGYLASLRDVVCNASHLDDCAHELAIRARLLIGEGSRVIYGFTVACGARELLSGRGAVALGARAGASRIL